MGVTLQPEFNAQTYYGTQTAGAEEFATSFGTPQPNHSVTELMLICVDF
jgi:hypothetical protein